MDSSEELIEPQKAQVHLKFQSDFQKLFIGLATHLINVPSSYLDNSITETLRDIGLFLHTNRCTIQILDETRTQFSRAYEWHAPQAVSRLNVVSSVENYPNVLITL